METFEDIDDIIDYYDSRIYDLQNTLELYRFRFDDLPCMIEKAEHRLAIAMMSQDRWKKRRNKLLYGTESTTERTGYQATHSSTPTVAA